jgi:hypothetical protein
MIFFPYMYLILAEPSRVSAAEYLPKLLPPMSASALSLARNRANTPSRSVAFKTSKDEDDDLEKCFLRVNGMTCGSCVNNIERGLSKVEGKVML